MRLNLNTDGGATNRRIPRRRYRMAAAPKDAGGTSMPIVEMNMLQRLRYASDYFFVQAERERKRGGRADLTLIAALMKAGAMAAAKAAPYLHPKVAAMQFEVNPSKPQQRQDLSKLAMDELDELERLVRKAAVTDEGQQPIPSDEYLSSDKPSP